MIKIVLVICGIIGLAACANTQQEKNLSATKPVPSKIVTFQGTIAVLGGSRMQFIGITNKKDGKQYKILNPKAFHLFSKQNQTITLQAILRKKSLGMGLPAEIEVVKILPNS